MNRSERLAAIKKSTTSHFILKQPNGKVAHATVVGTLEGTRWHVGVSLCSSKDHFKKKKGRLQAIKRLSEHLRPDTWFLDGISTTVPVCPELMNPNRHLMNFHSLCSLLEKHSDIPVKMKEAGVCFR